MLLREISLRKLHLLFPLDNILFRSKRADFFLLKEIGQLIGFVREQWKSTCESRAPLGFQMISAAPFRWASLAEVSFMDSEDSKML